MILTKNVRNLTCFCSFVLKIKKKKKKLSRDVKDLVVNLPENGCSTRIISKKLEIEIEGATRYPRYKEVLHVEF